MNNLYINCSHIIKTHFKVCVSIIQFFLVFNFIGCSSTSKIQQTILIFRLDDITENMSTDNLLRIINIFEEQKAPLTLSIVPFICSSNVHDPNPQDLIPFSYEKAVVIKSAIEKGTVHIAQHGFSHQTNNLKKLSEFSGMEYNEIHEKISSGKKYLENIIDSPINCFVPPWNQYDTTLLKVLQELNFTTLSASIKGLGDEKSEISYLPATCSTKDLSLQFFDDYSSENL